ncbi:MAG TPA: hypothetical protein PLQ81_07345, partial [bacterium]|nr:hypothetical protein [bacterium]
MKNFGKVMVLAFVCFVFVVSCLTEAHANGTAGGTLIQAGWDGNTANIADTPGDLVVTYKAISGGADIYATPASFGSSQVANVYGNTLPLSYSPQVVSPGDTLWYLLTITNKGNAADSMLFSTQNFNYFGMGADSIIVSIWNAAKTSEITYSSLLAEDASEQFNVAVYFKTGLDNDDSMTFEVKAAANGGLGGDAAGYIGANSIAYAGDGDDTILLSATVSAQTAQIYVAKSVAVDNTGLTDYDGNPALVVPGSVLTFDIVYDNDGTGSAEAVSIVAFIPANTDLDTATAAMCAPDT